MRKYKINAVVLTLPELNVNSKTYHKEDQQGSLAL